MGGLIARVIGGTLRVACAWSRPAKPAEATRLRSTLRTIILIGDGYTRLLPVLAHLVSGGLEASVTRKSRCYHPTTARRERYVIINGAVTIIVEAVARLSSRKNVLLALKLIAPVADERTLCARTRDTGVTGLSLLALAGGAAKTVEACVIPTAVCGARTGLAGRNTWCATAINAGFVWIAAVKRVRAPLSHLPTASAVGTTVEVLIAALVVVVARVTLVVARVAVPINATVLLCAVVLAGAVVGSGASTPAATLIFVIPSRFSGTSRAGRTCRATI